jgi:hypothetical protein
VRDLIEQLRLRNFILCYRGGGSYSFVHRTFLEYFCATAIHQRFVQKLDLDYLLNEIYAPHWQDEKWHEVLCSGCWTSRRIVGRTRRANHRIPVETAGQNLQLSPPVSGGKMLSGIT